MVTMPWPRYTTFVDNQKIYRRMKRVLDIVLSIVLLVLALPIFVVIALLIRVDSPGPIIFKQKRIGRAGRMFWCYKFRTMVCNAESLLEKDPELKKQYMAAFKIDNDIRVTRLGRVLRKTSLDELPQLFNILRGDISLIGPRPIVRNEVVMYGRHAGKLLSVDPGLSGLWQVSGRSDITYEQRVSMDMTYIDHTSLWGDVLLIFRTIAAVLNRRGAR